MKNKVELRANISILIGIGYFIACLAGYLLPRIICYTIPIFDGYDSDNFEHISYCISLIELPRQVFGGVAGAVVMLALSFSLLRGQLKDRQSTGAAWVLGSKTNLGLGIFIGLLIGAVVQITKYASNSPDIETLHLQNTILITIGYIYVIFIITIQPIIEELLIRGIVLGGFNSSFGLMAGGITTSIIYILMHSMNFIDSISAFIGITLMAAGTLWIRLTSSAIGPAIAMHISYNLICSMQALCELRRSII